MPARIVAIEADLTSLSVDAIVNAAAEALMGGGGVDGAVHRAAGPGLVQECRALPLVRPFVRCPTGEARITGGYALPARHVIHTVGPIWYGGQRDEAVLLENCYLNSLALAEQHGLASIAFPAISCGVFGYPVDQAVPLAVATVRDWLAGHDRPATVTFCCFGTPMLRAYERALAAAGVAP